MRSRSIPSTELSPSVICLGTSHFGDTISRETSFELMDHFLDRGGNFLDTAKVYGDWVPGGQSLSEKIIGHWLKSRKNRSRIVLATKGAHPDLDTMHIQRLSREDIFFDVEQSLQHLQTDYIDLYWLHRDDSQRPIEDIIDVMNELVRQGKIRYFGCSNWRSERIEAAQQYAKKKGIHGFVASQNKWSLATYPPENDHTMVTMDEKELSYHERMGLTAIPYNSQASGFFSGRYKIDMLNKQGPENMNVWKFCSQENIRKLKCVKAIAQRLNITMTQVSLGYLLSYPFPVFPISGCKNLTQLDDSCRAGEVLLDRHTLEELQGTK
ncbi:aldo/keto reductase [Paenibacillus alginolyticus]|uniref:Aldo/keto reductase n=1 Tax=Paenibacillus alginolyticus TaxID=59839 RepID=A0ABT4G8H7_9BACL|nr:aldo/keto reductase [Paenibacillus alginolyticus]MCY9668109.1 aldo/keto reductase [Paenibacillus alginolyticus]MCY9692468.1 aldo/keto reductase [Paenibacillus alginolyticus]MEC0144260.1 aldo/keto reductase [Paenibacillus alginolyticus]